MWISAIALSMSVTYPAIAGSHNKKDKQSYYKKFEEKLNLTDEQKKQIKDIKKQYWKDQKSKFEELRNLRQQMHELVKSEKIDEQKLQNYIDKKKEIVGAMTKSKIEMKNKIYNLLNEDQKKTFDEMLKKWQKKRYEMHKKMMDKKEANNNDDDDDNNDY